MSSSMKNLSINLSNIQESDKSAPVPAATISVEAVGIVQLLHVKFLFAHEVVVTAHDSSQRTHKAWEQEQVSGAIRNKHQIWYVPRVTREEGEQGRGILYFEKTRT